MVAVTYAENPADYGALRASAAHRHDQPPPGSPCERCRLIFVADFTTPRSPAGR
jgi:hypothetical protein